MAFLIPTNAVQIARFANGLYGLQLGFASTNGIVSDVASGGLLSTFNNYYTLSFGSQTTASVAQQILTNLGITTSNGLTATAVSAALAYVTGQLNTAAPNARGAAVKSILDLWSSISADPVNGPIYGTAATAWNTTISAAVQYAGAVNPDVTVAQASAINTAKLSQPVSYTAVTGADSYLGGTASPNSVTATANGTTATFTSGDSFTGGTGVQNSINISDSTAQATTATTWTPTATGGITVNGFQSATFTSNNSIVANTTATGGSQGWSGLTSLTVNDNAANGASTTITAAPTTNITLSEQNAGAAGVVTTIAGGNAVTLAITGNTGSTTTIGGTTALLQPTGAISVTNTVPSVQPTTAAPTVAIAATGGAITIQGGTTIGVTQTLTPPAVLPTTSNVATTAGAVTITGTANTSAVTVTQTKAAGYTATVNYGGMVATGANNPTLTITNPAGTATLVITGLSPANGGSPTGYTAAQVAAIANMSNTIGTALSPIPGLSSVLTLTGTATSYGYSTGAAGPSGSTITYTGSPTGGSASSAILAANFTAANGTTNAQVAAATGNIYDGNVIINDINANSSANGAIKSVVLDGLSANNGAAGSAVINANSMTSLTVNNFVGTGTVTISNNQSGTTNTTLNLSLLGSGGSSNNGPVGLIDTNAELTTLNITTAGTASQGSTVSLNSGFNRLTGITIAGTTTVTFGQVASTSTTGSLSNATSLTSISVSGKAGLTGTDVSVAPKLTSVTSSSSGPIQIALSQTSTLAQSFVSTGSGMDIITIGAQAQAPITAGTNANNYLVWNAAAPSTLTTTGGTVTGFNTLATTNQSSGTFNLTSIGSGYTSIDVISLPAATIGFTGVTPGTTLQLDGGAMVNTSTTVPSSGYSGTLIPSAGVVAWNATGNVNYTITGTNGGTQSLSLNLGIPSNDPRIAAGLLTRGTVNGFTVGTITLADASTIPAATNGIGTVTINSSSLVSGVANTISTLSDIGLSTLNLTGTAATIIGNMTAGLTSTLTINNTSSSSATSWVGGVAGGAGGFVGGSITNNNLNVLNIQGTGAIGIGTLSDTQSVLTINDTNSNPSSPVIGTLTTTNLSGLTITGGGIQILVDGTTNSVTSINNVGGPTTIGVAAGTPNYVAAASGLTSNAIGNLTISGNQPVAINGFIGTTTPTVTSSNTAAVTIPVIGSILHTSETFMNAGSGTMVVGNSINNAIVLQTLNLIGNVAYTNSAASGLIGSFVAGTTQTVTSTTGLVVGETISAGGASSTIAAITNGTTFTTAANLAVASSAQVGTLGAPVLASVTAGSDNANINLNLGVSTAAALRVNLGNGNDTITDLGTTVGGVFTLGSGINTINLGAATSTRGVTDPLIIAPSPSHAPGTLNITVGAELASTANTQPLGALAAITNANGTSIPANPAVAPYYIYGTDGTVMKPGDTITFAGSAAFATAGTVPSIAQFSQPPTSLANLNGLVQTVGGTNAANTGLITRAGGVASFTTNGDTYIVADAVAGTPFAVVEITGIHQISSANNGVVTILT